MLSGWGGLALPGRERLGEDLVAATRGAVLSRGLGRSYGDSSLPAVADDLVAGTRFANRILTFDEARGILRAEAGLSLAELNPIVMARGFFPRTASAMALARFCASKSRGCCCRSA